MRRSGWCVLGEFTSVRHFLIPRRVPLSRSEVALPFSIELQMRDNILATSSSKNYVCEKHERISCSLLFIILQKWRNDYRRFEYFCQIQIRRTEMLCALIRSFLKSGAATFGCRSASPQNKRKSRRDLLQSGLRLLSAVNRQAQLDKNKGRCSGATLS